MVETIISLRREQSSQRIVRGLAVPLCSAAVAGMMLLQAAVAMTLPTNAPPLRQADGIEYLSGGIGSDEASVMRGLAPQFKVRLRFLDSADGSALSDVSVTLFNAQRDIVLQVVSEGPYLYLNPPPGPYRVLVRYGKAIACHHFHVAARGHATDLVLRLPARALAGDAQLATPGPAGHAGCRGTTPCCGAGRS
ncbi:carboxypeptidase-like regulatory domain-containing protein [Cupriavidus pinatubonensis]|uniref:Carboxypeptidase regulatory-like domain-containing protein n=1 Tax=Cupriavidus pinatubonensis TaxID=248026 RepID=A0ABN7ZIP2_9BURK|nr:carboxypeptidase-like regulatory domain-containing protein [Cupriavidus pinatubonensis]CAG9185614.1 hypothetical protein LMG23994_05813 [Cupriavidus pinatubonensis]